MATSFKISEKEGRIDHLQFNTYHTMQRLWKSVQQILRYFGLSEKVRYDTKLLSWQSPLRYWKIFLDLSSTPKTLSYGVKIAKIAHRLCFAYNTILVAMTTSLEESEKLDLIEKTHANTFHLVKNPENQSSRYWDSFAHSKKINKLKNAWQSLVYSLLGAVVLSPSEYLWKTLTYWSPECLTAPAHCERKRTKRGNNYRLRPYNFFCLKICGDLSESHQIFRRCTEMIAD